MKVTMLWDGGINYATPHPEDAEHYASIREAVDEFERRMHHPYYPCVEDPQAWLLAGHVDPDDVGRAYPERLIVVGPKGGVRLEPT